MGINLVHVIWFSVGLMFGHHFLTYLGILYISVIDFERYDSLRMLMTL